MAPGNGSRLRIHRAAIALSIVGTLGLLALFVVVHRSQRGSAARLIALARSDFEAGRYVESLAGFAEVHRRLPEDPRFAQAAAESAIGAGRRAEAVFYARRAWDTGLRSESLLAMLMLEPGLLEADDRETRIGALIAQLEDPAAQMRSRARLLAEIGQGDDAISAWQASFADDLPDEKHVDEYLDLITHLGQRELLLKECRRLLDAGRLTATGYRHLALAEAYENLSLPLEQRSNPLDRFAQAESAGRLDDRCRLDAVLHAWFRLDSETALRWAERIEDPQLAIDARLFQAMLLQERAQTTELAKLAMPIGAHGPRAEGLSEALRGFNEQIDLDARILALQKAEKLIGNHPVLSITMARIFQFQGRGEGALVAYQHIDGFASLAPTVLIGQAEVLAALGRREAALSLLATSEHLHGSTYRSLVLLESLTANQSDPSLHQAVRAGLARLGKAGPDQDDTIPLGGTAVLSLPLAQRSLLDQARHALAQGDFAEVLTICDRVEAPATVLAAYRTLALQGLGHGAEALAASRIARSVPQPASVNLGAAAAALQAGDFSTAETILASVDGSVAIASEAQRLRILAALAQGDAQLVQERLAQAQLLEPGEHAFFAALLALIRGDRSSALATLQQARAHVLGDPLALQIFARLLVDSDQRTEAEALLVEALTVGAAESVARRHLAVLRADHGDFTGAIAALAPHQDPDDTLLRLRIHIRAKDFTAARRQLEVLPESTDPTDRILASAAIEHAAGRIHAAALILSQHLEHEPVLAAWLDLVCTEHLPVDLLAVHDSGPLERVRSILFAAAAERLGRFDQALAITAIATAKWEDDAALLNNQAWYLHRSHGDVQRALSLSRQAISLAPNDANLRDTLVSICIDHGRWDEAADGLVAASDLIASSPALLYAQGLVQRQRGHASAVHSFSTALALADRKPAWPLRIPRADLVMLIEALR